MLKWLKTAAVTKCIFAAKNSPKRLRAVPWLKQNLFIFTSYHPSDVPILDTLPWYLLSKVGKHSDTVQHEQGNILQNIERNPGKHIT